MKIPEEGRGGRRGGGGAGGGGGGRRGGSLQTILLLLLLVSVPELLRPAAGQPQKFPLDGDCYTVRDGPHKGRVDINCDQLASVDHFRAALSKLSSIGSNTQIPFEVVQINVTRSDPAIALSVLGQDPLPGNLTLGLRRLMLTNCNLTSLPENFFDNLTLLEFVDLSNNELTHFNIPLELNSSIRYLNLSHNRLQEIKLEATLNGFPSLEHLILVNNSLTTLGPEVALVGNNLTRLELEYNPWDCDEDFKWVLKWVVAEPLVFEGREGIKCSAPEPFKGMTFIQAKSVYESPICRTCDCFLVKEALAVNCSHKHLEALPVNLPINTKIVSLENNEIKSLKFPAMAGDWHNVTYFHLNNNTIDSFIGFEGTKILHHLRSLHIRRNRIQQIPIHILQQLNILDTMYMGDNPWQCDCEHTVPFQNWLQQHFRAVQDMEEIKCAEGDDSSLAYRNGIRSEVTDPQFAGRTLYRIPKPELCPQPSEPVEYLDILSIILAMATLVILVKLCYDWWWQKKTGKLPQFFKINI